jgi:fucose 4-O-acetylase-like acetyltransferase
MIVSRRADIDAAKGFAILFVVFGHLVARTDPIGVTWYEPLRRAVYAFHMPFFLYLSGMVAVLSGSLFVPLAAWPKLLRSRSERLLAPFFGLGLLVILGKLATEKFMFVDNQPGGLLAGLASLFWHTSASPAISIWYLFVLFVVSLAAPLIIEGRRSRLPVLLAASMLLYIIPFPAYIYLDRIGRYSIFFVLGAYAATLDTGWTNFIDRSWLSLMIVLVIFLLMIASFGAGWPPCLTLLPAGLLSMPAIHGLVRKFGIKTSSVFLFLGRYSFMIYLFNTLFIGLIKGLLLNLCSWNAPFFLPFAIALMIAGTLGPVALKRYAFRHIRVLDHFTN